MTKQSTVRLAIILLPPLAYGLPALIWVCGDGPTYNVPAFAVLVFSLFYSLEWMNDIKAEAEMENIMRTSGSKFVKTLMVFGYIIMMLALAPFAILRFAVHNAGYTAGDAADATA